MSVLHFNNHNLLILTLKKYLYTIPQQIHPSYFTMKNHTWSYHLLVFDHNTNQPSRHHTYLYSPPFTIQFHNSPSRSKIFHFHYRLLLLRGAQATAIKLGVTRRSENADRKIIQTHMERRNETLNCQNYECTLSTFHAIINPGSSSWPFRMRLARHKISHKTSCDHAKGVDVPQWRCYAGCVFARMRKRRLSPGFSRFPCEDYERESI